MQPTIGPYGAYRLDGGSDRPYHGKFRNQAVIIVGANTGSQRLFLVTQREEAKRYAKENDVGIVRAIAAQIPDNLALDLFGA